MTERCDCCDLPVESCGKAAEQRLRAERQQEIRYDGPAVTARFVGHCASCGTSILGGDTIRFTSDSGGYVGECCS